MNQEKEEATLLWFSVYEVKRNSKDIDKRLWKDSSAEQDMLYMQKAKSFLQRLYLKQVQKQVKVLWQARQIFCSNEIR